MRFLQPRITSTRLSSLKSYRMSGSMKMLPSLGAMSCRLAGLNVGAPVRSNHSRAVRLMRSGWGRVSGVSSAGCHCTVMSPRRMPRLAKGLLTRCSEIQKTDVGPPSARGSNRRCRHSLCWSCQPAAFQRPSARMNCSADQVGPPLARRTRWMPDSHDSAGCAWPSCISRNGMPPSS